MRGFYSRGPERTVAALLVAICSALVFGAVRAGGSTASAPSYVAVDLGTLGGTAGEARFTNDDGDVVGYSTTASGQWHMFLRSPSGAMDDLGPGSATGLNSNGQVVGLRPTPSGAFHGFVWTRAGGMVDLSFAGAPSDPSRIVGAAWAENDAGEVAGMGVTSSGDYHAFVWTAGSGLVDIGCLNGSGYCQATGISEAGHVAGECYVSGRIHACSWTPANGWIDLGSLGGDTHVWSYEQTGPVVNSSGQAIGYGVVDPAYDIHAFSASPASGMIDLGTLGGNRSWANSVNEAGQVVGGSVTSTGEVHPFSWTQAGGMVDLCGSASGSYSDAYAVNGGGQVVGACYLANGAYRAFLWSSADGKIDLPGLGLGNGVAYDVSDNGKIVGTSFNAFNQARATLWKPADTTAPTLTVPTAVVVEATSAGGAAVGYAVTATDDTDPNPTVVCTPPSGSVFPLGVTTVSCTATDASGNSASGSFTVKVVDTTPPVLTLPANKVVDATGRSGATVSYTATATDTVDPSPAAVCSPPSGSVFAIGTTTVTCTATDSSGNSSHGSFSIKVKGAGEQLADLASAVKGVGPGKSLAATVEIAQWFLAHGQPRLTCLTLTAFQLEVRAQAGKKIPAVQAAALIADANRIKTVLGCAK